MKFLYQILMISAVAVFSVSAHAQSVELSDTDSNTTVSAIIEPHAAAVGKAVNVWISAVYKGVPYFYNGSAWVAYTGGPYPIAIKAKVLSKATKLPIAKEAGLSAFPGADLYVGYGMSEEDMKSSATGKLTKVAKVGKRFKWAARPVH